MRLQLSILRRDERNAFARDMLSLSIIRHLGDTKMTALR